MRKILWPLLVLLGSETAYSHARLLSVAPAGSDPLKFESPKPRDTEPGYKIFANSLPPCGNNTASATLTNYTQGQKIKVQWEETIQHLGYYVFQISSDGINFTTIAEYIDDQDGAGNTPHLYPSAAQAAFVVPLPPNLVCDKCVFRFIQHMDTNKVAHANLLDNVDYFSCADIKIAATVVQPPPEPPAPPAPPPPPTNNNGNTSQSSTALNGGAKFSSCAMIANDHRGGGLPPGTAGALAALLLMPLLLLQALRPARVRRKNF